MSHGQTMSTIPVPTDSRVVMMDVTPLVAEALANSGLRRGALLVYVPHTTAGVTINENADPTVRRDILMTLDRLVPESLPFAHGEGNSDAHVKATLVGSSVLVPVADGRLALGTWQGIFFCEFDGPRQRRLVVQPLAAPNE
jgi:secondary thiamine-phosphate synthase enzyme